MKLVPKLTALFILGTSGVLGINGYLRVRREVRLFQSDRVRNDQLMAAVLARGASAIWTSSGKQAAIHMIDELGAHTEKLRIRWQPFEQPAQNDNERRLRALSPGSSLSVDDVPLGAERGRCVFSTLEAINPPPGAVSLCETYALQSAYVRKSITETLITTGMLGLVFALTSGLIGFWLVARPVSALSAQARRIGEGDFSSPLVIPTRDEFGALAHDMNAMCAQLSAAAARVEREIARRVSAVEQLRHADRLTTVGELASGLAHELGTPLNVIEARAHMIVSGETTLEESKDYARVIREASERMTRLIRKLLDFARPQQGERAECRLFELAAKTADLLAPLAQRKNVRVVASESSSGISALVDSNQIEQVLTNLIVNAIQAVEHGGRVDIQVSSELCPVAEGCDAPGEFACLSVRDDGPGIPSEHLARVFEPFFTTKKVENGTGLGLAVAYGIVRDHGGWITVHSELGKGTCFQVYVPKGELT